MNHRPLLALASFALLSACGGTPPVVDAPASDGTGAEAATDSTPAADGAAGATDGADGAPREGGDPAGSANGKSGESSTGSPPKPAAPKTRIEQCQVLGTGMQQVQQVGPIANAGDGTKLLAMAKDLRVEAESLLKAQLALPALAALRDRYVETTNEMAAALEAAAATTKAPEQKASVERFRKLEPTLTDHMDKLNEICNAPRK